MRFKCLLVLFLAFISIEGFSQACTTLGQNPATAFPVCGTNNFVQNNVPLCGGANIPTSCTGGACGDVNPFWYRFTCYTAGTLGFIIDPMNNADDYDWVLFDITGRNPNDIYTVGSLIVAENWSATAGNTGTSTNFNGLKNCAGGTPNFSSMPTLIVGHEYLLMVSNWSASQQGYTLAFGGGTAVITDPLAPSIQSATASCDGTQVTVRFNKSLKCNSIAANGSDFSVAGGTIVSATGFNCTASFDFDSVLVTLSPGLAAGNYTISMAMGTDGNTLLDNCGTPIPVANNTTFTVAAQSAIAMGTITPPACTPNSLTLTFVDPINCSSVAANGSDFVITGPSTVNISSATAVNCNAAGQTNTITIQLSGPILANGNYQVTAATGTDGNTLVGSCNRQIPAGISSSFILAAQAPIAMGIVTPPPCTPITITLTFTDLVNCNSIAANGSDFQITGPSSVTVTSATAVNCNATGETNTITIQFSSPILTSGNYQVVAATGSDGNTLIGICNRQVVAGTSSQFTLAAQAPIAMGAVTPPACTPSTITLTFSDPINCSSIASNGSDFQITGPSTVNVTGIFIINCNNLQTNTINIYFSGPILTSGNYQVIAAVGTDGNTLTGQCNSQVTAGTSSPFTLAAQAPIAMGTVQPPTCTPTTITLNFIDAINCNSVAANGSDFTVTGPSAVTVTAATAVNCNANGETNTITLQFAGPILTSGNYQVTAMAGSDGNTLIGLCNREVTAGTSSSFTLAAQAPILMGTIAPPPCIPSTITLNFAAPINCNSIAANGTDFLVSGPSSVTVSSATAVNCDANGQTSSINIQFSGPILSGGNYQVTAATGSDGNTLVGQCNRQVTAGSSSSFTLAAQTPIAMGTITAPNCSPASIVLNFTDNILCNSIAANGSDFIVSGPTGVVVNAATAVCNANGETNSITIQFSSPIIVSGNYQLQVVNGNDGNSLLGNCNRSVNVGEIANFVIPPASAVAMDSLVPIACAPSSLELVFAAPLKCASIAANGSDFQITGSTPVIITSASGTCDANGLTTRIKIQLSSAIVSAGTYQLQLITGSDGNTLLSDCNRPTPPSTLSFIASDTVSAAFTYQVQLDCQVNTIDFAHDGANAVNQWTWTINNISASTAQTFSQDFSSSGQNLVSLTVSNGMCSDTWSENIVLNNKVTAAFTAPDVVCPGDSAIFINNSSGPIGTWAWTFGNGNNSSAQHPAAQVYPLTGTEILYTVSLTVSNANCQTTTSEVVKVFGNCIIAVPTAFTPNNDGLNDYLYPLNAIKAENLDFKVYNRWGQLVFSTNDWTKKWDGKINGVMQATNVYIWTLNYTHRDTRIKFNLKGTSTLIR